ncbi:BRCA2 [Acrasis kona]|uniref:BRCA2 n=1 Tax=Acrasis kona TaxID=1008807 RepID=A0AAW2Z6X7_9EUKA
MSDSDSDYDDYDQVEQEKPKPKGIASLSSISGLGSEGKKQKDAQEEKLLGDEITVVFKLPNGEAKKHQVNLGRPIEWLKVLVEREHGIPFDNQDMYINDKSVPNPMSLSDIPSVSGTGETVIVVKVRICDNMEY